MNSRTRKLIQDRLKESYLDYRSNNPTLNYMSDEDGNSVYTAQAIFKLRDMAKHDVYPDYRFSDEECAIWEAFHIAYKHKT